MPDTKGVQPTPPGARSPIGTGSPDPGFFVQWIGYVENAPEGHKWHIRREPGAWHPAEVVRTWLPVSNGRTRVDPAAVQPIGDADRHEVGAFVAQRWGSPHIVTRAREHDVRDLPGFLLREDGRVIGALTLSVQGPDCEIVTIDAAEEGRGIGTALLSHAERYAREHGCDRTWLVTTNDNLRALYFYQRQSYRIMSVHRDAVTRTRDLRPHLPLVAANGIAIHDEIELEKNLPK